VATPRGLQPGCDPHDQPEITSMFDIGNMLRFPSELPPAFADGFTAGYATAGSHLPENWRELSQAADLFALADFLTRPPEHPFFGKAVNLIRDLLTHDGQGT